MRASGKNRVLAAAARAATANGAATNHVPAFATSRVAWGRDAAPRATPISAVSGSNGNSDARADDHLLTFQIVRLADRFLHSLRQRSCLGGLFDDALHDGKLVATEAGNRVRLPDAAA